jgi:hypothetical protein
MAPAEVTQSADDALKTIGFEKSLRSHSHQPDGHSGFPGGVLAAGQTPRPSRAAGISVPAYRTTVFYG